MKKFAVIILLVGAASAVVYFLYFRKESEAAIEWRTSKIEKGNITTLVSATGTISALTTVQVGTQVNGTVSRLLADFNSVVKKGDVIAILDTTFLVASRDDAAANVDRAKAQLNQYTREFNRARKLYAEHVNTQVEYESALTNFELGKSNLKSAEAQLRRAKINLQYATIKAPISGTVISRNVDVGQTVISSFNTPTLFSIANDLTKMELQANIDEADIGQISVDEQTNFTVDAYPNEIFKGNVKQIRLQPITVQNVVNYVVIIDVPNPELKLMPGMTANLSVIVKERNDIFKVPVSALHFTPPAEYISNTNENTAAPTEMERVQITQAEENNAGVIWLLKDEVPEMIQIKTGISDGAFIEIEGPIHLNDVVITGISNHNTETSTSTQNPFMPRMPRGRNR